MNGEIGGTVCVVAGLAVVYGGFALVKSQEHPAGTTGFEGPGLNRRGLLIFAGKALIGFGLILAVIFSAFFFIGG